MFISVIIPVYNAERYLSSCLESLLAQRYDNFEVLLINDGSRDGSRAICESFALRDDRIRLFNRDNRGVSAARNYGLDHAQGDFVLFIDADDYLANDHLEQFAKSGIREGGIAFSNFTYEHESGRSVKASIQDVRIEGNSAACLDVVAQLLRQNCFGWCWCKLFSRATIERYKLRFLEDCDLSEDEIFTAEYCLHIDQIICNSHPTYHYRQLSDSLLHKSRKAEEIFRARTYVLRQYELLGYRDEVFYIVLRRQLSHLRAIMKRDNGAWNSQFSNESTLFLHRLWRDYLRSIRLEYIIGTKDLR